MSYKYRKPYKHTCTGTEEFKGCGVDFLSRMSKVVLCQDCNYRKGRWKAAVRHREKKGHSDINVCQKCVRDVLTGHQCYMTRAVIVDKHRFVAKGIIQRSNPERMARIVNDILKGRINLV